MNKYNINELKTTKFKTVTSKLVRLYLPTLAHTLFVNYLCSIT